MKQSKSKWRDMGNNRMLQSEGFYISYNPNTAAVTSLFTTLGNALGGDLRDGEETALVKEVDGKQVFSILTGDFRKQYEKLVDKGYDACYAYFKKQQAEHGNNWSTEEEDR